MGGICGACVVLEGWDLGGMGSVAGFLALCGVLACDVLCEVGGKKMVESMVRFFLRATLFILPLPKNLSSDSGYSSP